MSLGLTSAYVHARYHRGPMFVQTTPYDLRTPSTTLGNNPIVSAAAYQSVGGGWSHIPDLATHVVGVGIYKITQAADATPHCRVVVYDGSNTDTGTDSPAEAGRSIRDLQTALYYEDDYSPFAPSAAILTTVREVTLANVIPPVTALVKYQMYVTDRGLAGVAFWPLLFLCWWECRE